MRRLCVITFQFTFICFCFCEFSENKDKYLNAFVNHLNSLPDQALTYDEADLIKLQEIKNNEYCIEIRVKSSDQNSYSTKYQNCTATLTDEGDDHISIVGAKCFDFIESWTENLEELVTDVTTNDGPIQLENEVQSENMSTSGERFIAVPRDHPAPCIGCASYVDPHAAGVKELAGLGIRQLDRHAPNLRHSLNNVISVERQVQVVGGVRYIMTLAVDYDNCTSNETGSCNFQKTCKVTILEKPWQKLPGGSKFRAIVSNNCTEEWLFDENNINNENNDIINPAVDDYGNSRLTTPEYDHTGVNEDSVKAVQNSEVQAQPNAEKSLTDDQIRELEEQIIPVSDLNQPTGNNYYAVTDSNQDTHITEEKDKTLGDAKPSDEFTSTQQPDTSKATSSIPEDKKKAIDELMNFFDFTGLKDKLNNEDLIRMKRDYGSDLQILNLAENYQDMKTKIKNAQFIHKLAQAMVDHLNEIDIEVKNRVLLEVISAEEEFETDMRYFYVQARVTSSCDRGQCKEREVKICNGIIDATKDQPSVLYTVCNSDRKKGLGRLKDVREDDPILLKYLSRAMKRIDIETKLPYALRIRKILSASTQRVSGIVTKISVEIEYTECFKTVPLFKRNNCTALENLGLKLCDIEIFERHWLKESKITYVCTERPVDEIFVSDSKNNISTSPAQLSVDDPQVLEILQEALIYLETKSNRNNKQKLVEVKSVSTQQVAGMLTNIAFTVGYTVCTSEYKDDVNTCELLDNEPLRNCSVELWERPWLEDDRQLNVTCETFTTKENDLTKSENRDTLVGGPLEKEVDDPQYKSLAEESLQKYFKKSANSQHYRLIKIDKVTLQIVSGTLTTIDFHISPTNCQVNSDGQPTSVDCIVQNADGTVSCRSKIWERPWLKFDKKLIDVNCNSDNEKNRKKRSIVTTENEIEENPNEYKNLADDCLTNYMATDGTDKHHKVIRINKVVKVNTTGDLTKIDFVAGPTNCSVKNGYPTSSPCEINDVKNTLTCHASIWVKPFLNGRIMNVNCQIDEKKFRRKRQVLGGNIMQDTNDPKFKALAEQALKKYVLRSRISQYHDVVSIEHVTQQLVSGLKTEISFMASPTNCLIDRHGKPTSNVCKINKENTTLRCNAEILEKAWLGKEDIIVNCHYGKSREKIQVPGEKTQKNASDPKYMQLAEESLAKYVATTGTTQQHKIIRISKVTTQVVAGKLTDVSFDAQLQDKILQCHSNIWERPWLKEKEINVTCSPATTSLKERKRRSIFTGMWTEQNANDPKYTKLAEESLEKYVSTSGTTQHHKIVQIEKVTTQVVSGVMTNIDFKVSPTDCQVDNNGQPTSSNCKIQNLASLLYCHSNILEQKWLNKKEITVTCNPNKPREKRQVPGGKKEQDVSDPTYMQLAEESLAQYVADINTTQQHKIVRVSKVTTQVVSGKLTEIYFSVQREDHRLECHSKIWEQPWLKKKEITINCSPSKSRRRREIQLSTAIRSINRLENTNNRGGYHEEDPTKPKYIQLAEEALRKYQHRNRIKFLHKLIEVKRASSQVVSGTKYKIDFTAAPTTCATNVTRVSLCNVIESTILYCHTEIWDKLWMKRRDINVFCNIGNSDEEIDSNEEHQEDKKSKKKRSLFNEYKDFNDNPDQSVTPVAQLNVNHKNYKTDSLKQIVSNKTKNNNYFRKNKLYNSKIYLQLAEDSLREFENLSNSDVLYKVVKIHYVNEDEDLGIRIRLDFTASPSNCSTTENLNNNICQFVEPKELVSCHADIRFTLMLEANLVRNIEVKCAERKRKKAYKGGLDKARNKRQVPIDEYLEDDLTYYYADRAVSKLNTITDAQNLYKLITVHDVRRSVHMKIPIVRMYLEVAKSLCLRDDTTQDLVSCDEIDGLDHLLCYTRIWPSRYDDLVIEKVDVVCEDDLMKWTGLTGFSTLSLLEASMMVLNNKGKYPNYHRLIKENLYLIPTLDYNEPFKLTFLVAVTNCTTEHAFALSRQKKLEYASCVRLFNEGVKKCHSEVYMTSNSRALNFVNVSCFGIPMKRSKRSVPITPANVTNDDINIQRLIQASLEQLEMISVHNYKQRVLVINRYSTKITTKKETTIDFDVGYTNCLKFEWVDNITSCEFLEHLPRRHCVSIVREKLWSDKGREIHVDCLDDETPLEANMEYETAQSAKALSNAALKHIEYKYPHPRRQKVVRIFSLEKQMVAGIHYKMKMEVGYTNCMALSVDENCELDPEIEKRKFCRVNVWVRSWTNHPPSFRVTCDYQDGASNEIYHEIQTEHLFSYFLNTYKPTYINDHEEMRSRYNIFKENVKKIHELNLYEMGTARYAITRTADMSAEEFKAKFLGLNPKLRDENQVPMPDAEIPAVRIPDAFDWREHDAVTEVKNQGMCGSCWAFSVTGNIEGQWKRHSGKLVSLSEQELVDCDKLDQGCNGGLPDNAYRAIEQLGGLETESDYPYEGEDDKCAYNASLSRVQISGAVNISSNETDMAKWLVTNGPISIGINANAMQFYVGGVSHPWKMLCNPANLDHGVLIVGYGEKDYPLFNKKLPYWIVKNSWGKSWGEQGYYRVYRGDGTCGVNQMASSAVV